MNKLIATIENEQIIENDDGSVSYKSKAAIDSDGSGSSHGDPYWQNDTSLNYQGKALNADIDRYIVVPPAIIAGVKGIVLGCQAHVRNSLSKMETDAVVGDIGPHKKLGEMSCACASALGIDPSPTSGGVDAHVIYYKLWPGQPATVGDKTYELKASNAS